MSRAVGATADAAAPAGSGEVPLLVLVLDLVLVVATEEEETVVGSGLCLSLVNNVAADFFVAPIFLLPDAVAVAVFGDCFRVELGVDDFAAAASAATADVFGGDLTLLLLVGMVIIYLES